MKTLSNYLDGYYSGVQIDFNNPSWHTSGKIPSIPGWYFIRTNMPLYEIQKLDIWQKTYITKKKKEERQVSNYNIGERAKRFHNDLSSYWNLDEVYSGMTSNIQKRAKEHTFSDPGTASLALSRYPNVKKYEWLFGYLTLERFMTEPSCQEMLLNLGEQIWRSKNQWPILCAE